MSQPIVIRRRRACAATIGTEQRYRKFRLPVAFISARQVPDKLRSYRGPATGQPQELRNGRGALLLTSSEPPPTRSRLLRSRDS